MLKITQTSSASTEFASVCIGSRIVPPHMYNLFFTLQIYLQESCKVDSPLSRAVFKIVAAIRRAT